MRCSVVVALCALEKTSKDVGVSAFTNPDEFNIRA